MYPHSVNIIRLNLLQVNPNTGTCWSRNSLEDIYRDDCHIPFKNHDSYLEKLIYSSESVDHLREKLEAINEWCLLTINPNDYGFYSPSFIVKEYDYISIGYIDNYVGVYTCAVFKHSSDLLAFKLRF
jgi:hypothetical protein